MIDGGNSRSKQIAGKNAADFVDWKFKKEYGLDKIVIDAMIVSHCDEASFRCKTIINGIYYDIPPEGLKKEIKNFNLTDY